MSIETGDVPQAAKTVESKTSSGFLNENVFEFSAATTRCLDGETSPCPGEPKLQVKCAEIVARDSFLLLLVVVRFEKNVAFAFTRFDSPLESEPITIRGFSKLAITSPFFSPLSSSPREISRKLSSMERFTMASARPSTAETIIVRVFFSPNRMVVPSMSFSPTSSMCSSARGASSFTEIDLVCPSDSSVSKDALGNRKVTPDFVMTSKASTSKTNSLCVFDCTVKGMRTISSTISLVLVVVDAFVPSEKCASSFVTENRSSSTKP